MVIINEHYQRNPDFVFRKIIEETILVPLHKDVADMDCIYTLNEIGAFIWEKLDHPRSKAELEAAIIDEYEVTPQDASADLDGFLDEMTAIGALQKVEA